MSQRGEKKKEAIGSAADSQRREKDGACGTAEDIQPPLLNDEMYSSPRDEG